MDHLSKLAHFLGLSHPCTAKTVVEKFVNRVVRLHGMPKTIISDKDPIFISKFWQEFFKMSGTQFKMSSAYHSQTNGQFEVVNRCFKQYLRSLGHLRPNKWHAMLPWTKFWYNTTFHSSIGMTPFQALYGRPPPVVPNYKSQETPVAEVDHQLAARNVLLQQLKSILQAAQNRMQQLANPKRRHIEFQKGDWVFLRLRPYRQQTVFKRALQKLACKFYGPYQILQRIGPVTYKLKLPEGSRIHPVFHVSLLKQQIGDSTVTCTELPSTNEDGKLLSEEEEIRN